MAAPVYFFADALMRDMIDQTRFRSAFLHGRGVEHVFSDVLPQHCSRFESRALGPGGKSGCFVVVNTAGVPPLRAGYYPDQQAWTQIRKDPDTWIGIDKEHPPTPVDLVRPKVIAGWDVLLGDGNQWTVPVIRSVEHLTNLPRDMFYDADGEFHLEIAGQYKDLWDQAGKAWDVLHGYFASEEGVKYSEILELCLTFLGVNYRIGRMEQSALRLVTTSPDTWMEILGAVCDVRFSEMLATAEKKTEDPPAS